MHSPLQRTFVLLVLVVSLLTLTIAAQARSISVCASGCEFSSIQAGLAAANPGGGDVISLGAGVFVGPVLVGITVDIVGAGAGVSVIGGGMIVAGAGLTVNVRNVTLTKGLNGLAVLGLSHVFMRDSVLAENISDGILVGDLSSLELYNSTVAKNGRVISGNPIGAGIAAMGAGRVSTSVVTITGNVSAGVTAFGKANVTLGTLTSLVGNGLAEKVVPGFGGEGVIAAGAATLTIDGALIQGNGAAGVAVRERATASISNSTIEGNKGSGIQVGGPASVNPDVPLTATVTIQNNVITGNGSHGVLVGDPGKVRESANATISGNGITGNGGCGVGLDQQGASAEMANNFYEGNASGNVCNL